MSVFNSAPQPAEVRWRYLVLNDKQYRVRLGPGPQHLVLEAQIRIHAHSQKVASWRKVVLSSMLGKLQRMVRPEPVCPACGKPLGDQP